MTKITKRPVYSALDNSKPVKDPDLLKLADKNYASTILRYSNLAILYSQLDTDAKTIVGAINELNARPTEIPPAKPVGETDKLGGIFVGDGLEVTEEGVLSAQVLTPATSDKLGGVKVGQYLNVTSDGTLSVDSGAVGKTYSAGKLINISTGNVIGVNMTQSTPEDIEQESTDNPNVLFFTEGAPSTGDNIHVLTIVLVSSDWTDDIQVIALSPITQYSNIIIASHPDNIEAYTNFGIYGYSQSLGHITFKCRTVPDEDIRVNVAYWE